MAKTVLITGAYGQLGKEVTSAFADNADCSLLLTDVDTLDITNRNAVEEIFSNNNIDYLINCAAYTNVDGAQTDVDLCGKLNIDAVAYLAQCCKTHGAKMIHISTDYVFDGYNYKPYTEEDRTNPLSTYGTTKLDGERMVRELADEYIIIRTSWLYSPYGKNFVKTMLRLADEREEIKVVSDQVGTPTYAADLASAIYTIITSRDWKTGTYHFSNEGAASWYDLATAVVRSKNDRVKMIPISSSEYPTAAQRPFYSILDKTKIKETFNIVVPNWYESLCKCLSRLEK